MTKQLLRIFTLELFTIFSLQLTFADKLNRSAWVVTADSYEVWNNEEGGYDYIKDDNPATWWHTRWGTNHGVGTEDKPYPHYIQFDLGSSKEFDSFKYVARPKSGARIAGYKLYVSNNDITNNMNKTNMMAAPYPYPPP